MKMGKECDFNIKFFGYFPKVLENIVYYKISKYNLRDFNIFINNVYNISYISDHVNNIHNPITANSTFLS